MRTKTHLMRPSRPPPPPKGKVHGASQPDRELAQPAEASAVVYRPADFEHSVHLDAQSQILAGNGRIEEFASLAAYVCRVANLIGDQLGIGPITGIEATLENGVFLIHRDAHGDVVGIKPRPHLNLIQLKAQLNL
jgi:hypothetical protein